MQPTKENFQFSVVSFLVILAVMVYGMILMGALNIIKGVAIFFCFTMLIVAFIIIPSKEFGVI